MNRNGLTAITTAQELCSALGNIRHLAIEHTCKLQVGGWGLPTILFRTRAMESHEVGFYSHVTIVVFDEDDCAAMVSIPLPIITEAIQAGVRVHWERQSDKELAEGYQQNDFVALMKTIREIHEAGRVAIPHDKPYQIVVHFGE